MTWLLALRPVFLVLLIGLILTESRSASIGLFVGVGILAWQWRRQVPARIWRRPVRPAPRAR